MSRLFSGVYVAVEEAVLLLLQKCPCLYSLSASTLEGKKTIFFKLRFQNIMPQDCLQQGE